MPDLAPQIVTGVFAVAGGAVGAALTWLAARAGDKRRLKAEDERRWLVDRRKVYASYLGLTLSLLEEIDGVGVFLSYDGTQPIPEEDEELRREGLFEFHVRWREELQPALGEIQLLAGAEVAELADRASAALMDVTGPIETRQPFIEWQPTWYAARDLIAEMLKAMRRELGLPPAPDIARPRGGDWPWVPEKDGAVPARRRRRLSPRPSPKDGDSA